MNEFEKSESGLLYGGRVSICALNPIEEKSAGDMSRERGLE